MGNKNKITKLWTFFHVIWESKENGGGGKSLGTDSGENLVTQRREGPRGEGSCYGAAISDQWDTIELGGQWAQREAWQVDFVFETLLSVVILGKLRRIITFRRVSNTSTSG